VAPGRVGNYVRFHERFDLGEYKCYRLVWVAFIDCLLDYAIHLATEFREDSSGLFHLLCFGFVSVIYEGYLSREAFFFFRPWFVGTVMSVLEISIGTGVVSFSSFAR
jgi:hypothetical protein